MNEKCKGLQEKRSLKGPFQVCLVHFDSIANYASLFAIELNDREEITFK